MRKEKTNSQPGTTPNDTFASKGPAVLTVIDLDGASPYRTTPSDRSVAVVTLNVSVMRPSLFGATGLRPSSQRDSSPVPRTATARAGLIIQFSTNVYRCI